MVWVQQMYNVLPHATQNNRTCTQLPMTGEKKQVCLDWIFRYGTDDIATKNLILLWHTFQQKLN